MRCLVGCVGVLWLVAGCSVPDLEELAEQNPHSCNPQHPCVQGYACLQGACVRCEAPEVVVGYPDVDRDGYGAMDAAAMSFCGSLGAGYVAQQGDCDDADPSRRPALPEVCNGVDDNCAGGADEGLTFADYYRDGDGDGVGGGAVVKACAQPINHVTSSNDCDDTNSARTPGKAEVCDGVDNNCVGGVDEGLPATSYYRDNDGDGVGAGTAVSACARPAGHVTSSNDCDDNNSARTPGKAEVCDGVDNNCANGVDEGLPATNYYRDNDGDGVGAGAAVGACAQPAGHVTSSNDCDDNNSARTPGKAEVCDFVDNNCANGVDEGLPASPFHPDADGDTYGTAAGVVQRCKVPQGYTAPTSVFDCDDTKAAVNPAATEVCNNIDDNCVGGIDEGFNKSWYRDADMDTYGLQSNLQTNCVQPAGFVSGAPGFDCDDTRSSVHPGATEVCNNRDDNCVNGVDENFGNKGTACTNDVCAGQFVCKADGTGTECSAPAPVSYYPDADGDGEGQTGSTVQKVCSGPAPAGKVTTSTDCDDQDPHNRSIGTEVCDDRDNNCSSGKTDEAAVCGGKGWKVLTDPVVTSRNWNTVALGDSGEPVWLAGESGALAFRAAGTTTFIDRNQVCGTTRWNASWVQSSTGTIFLAGDGGSLAAYNGVTACSLANTGSATNNPATVALSGIVGFGSSNTVYAVNAQGQLYSWTPGSVPVFKAQRATSDPLRDLHGPSASRLLLVGADYPGEIPLIQSYDAVAGGTSLSADHTLTGIPTANNAGFLGVWAWDSTHAYAVGNKGLVMKWNGATGWSFASPDASVTTQFNSVVALDDSSVYIVGQDGRIRRSKASSWDVHYSGAVELKDIALSSRQNIWAVGNGVVVHFPE
jgi:hypothetical protein